MRENIVMQEITSLEEESMGIKYTIAGFLKALKEQIFPIFVSHLITLEIEEEHGPVRKKLEQLRSLWGVFLETAEKLEKIAKEEDTIEQKESKAAVAIRSIKKVTDKIKKEIKDLGEDLVMKIAQIERVRFFYKYKEFETMYRSLCEYSFGVMFIDPSGLSADMRSHVSNAEYRMYKCLSACEKLEERKRSMEKRWIPTEKYPQLKVLFKNCLFSLVEYLITYKLVVRCLVDQINLIGGIDYSQEMCKEMIDTLHTMIGALIEPHFTRYSGYTTEKKIQHHEASVARRRANVEEILLKHKKIMVEINSLNWKVGREAKNVINMEKAYHEKGELSIKRLFFLFEDIEKNLKKTEKKLQRCSKVMVTIKKTSVSESKLFTIKSLDFKYMIIEGTLRSFEDDLNILYTASKSIYMSHSRREI